MDSKGDYYINIHISDYSADPSTFNSGCYYMLTDPSIEKNVFAEKYKSSESLYISAN